MAPVTLELPDPRLAPNYRDYLTNQAEFSVVDVADSWVLLEPREGAGSSRQYFTVAKLADANTEIAAATWAPLRDCPPWEDRDVNRRQRLMAEAQRLAALGRPEATIRALEAGILAANVDVPELLEQQLPDIFRVFPNASLWLVCVDQILLARLIFLHSRIALELTPDKPLIPEAMGVHAMDGHSVSSSVMFHDLVNPLVLAFSPGAIGYSFAHSPHAIVLLYGDSVELREEMPRSLASLYEPGVLGDVHDNPWSDAAFWQDVPPEDSEALFLWWVESLNVIYSHIADPTRFEIDGKHQPEAQLAWFLTFERMIADATLILASPQAPQMTRLETAFDCLDKAEALLGYGVDASGKGFKRLLRRSETQARLERAWNALPQSLRNRFNRHTETLYDRMYAHVYDHALSFRQTTNQRVLVQNRRTGELVAQHMNDYAPELIRATRNSAHGFLDQLTGDQRHLVATHTGDVPPEIADLAPLILFGLVADGRRLIDGTWFD
jgi:hypothetical protein